MHWNILSQQIPKNLDQLITILVNNRNLNEDKDFFNPIHPTQLSLKQVGLNTLQMKRVMIRLMIAKKNHERVVIFGDYDADGVCATALLWQAIYKLGIDVVPFIPHREKHGYGLSLRALEDLLSEQVTPTLIITVDNGIVAHEAAKFISQKKIDLIITDHHLPEKKLPKALAIIHTTQLCGTTVAWMVARQLFKYFKKEIEKNWQLDLAAIATIADQVPLTGVNRNFAKHGILALQKSDNLGLKYLLNKAGVEQKSITSQQIAFVIAPRINAMGRLGHSFDSLRLLLTSNASRAHKLATHLTEINIQRQSITLEMLNQAFEQDSDFKNEHIILVDSLDYHPGIIGLIAGRLVEKYHKPAIVMSVGAQVVKASARSIKGINILELLRHIRSDLAELGGHPLAAGFEFETQKLAFIKKALLKLALKKINKKQLLPELSADLILPQHFLTPQTHQSIEKFAPFGSSNQPPTFVIKNLIISSVKTMGKNSQHLKIICGDDPHHCIELILWRNGELFQNISTKKSLDVLGELEKNEWQGRIKIFVKVLDVMLH